MQQILKNAPHLLFRRQTNILSAATIIMFTYGISNIIGLVKNRLLLATFFSSQAHVLDSYNVAFLIPDTIFQIFVMGSMSATFIPIFNKYFSRSKSDGWHMANSVINLTLSIMIIFSLIAFMFALPLVTLIARGFTPDQLAISANILRVALIAQIFFSISGFFTSIIQSNQRFILPALAPIVYNLSIIAGTYFLSPSLGIFGPTIGVVIGAFWHMAIQLPLVLQLGFRPSMVFDTVHPGVREVGKLMPPRAIALGIDQIEQLIAVILATLLSAGSVSLLNIARVLYNIPTTLFGITIGQAALPVLSHSVANSQMSTFRQTLLSSMFQVMFVAIPVSILFIVLRVPIVRLIFGAKNFPWEATTATATIVGILAVSAGFTAVMQLVVRGFYALHDTKTPLIVGLIFALFNTLLSCVLVFILNYGLVGIATSISITNIIESLVLCFIIHRRISAGEGVAYLFMPLLKIVFTAGCMGLVLWSGMQVLDNFVFDTTRTIPLLALTSITSIVGIALYIGLSYYLKIEQLESFASLGKKLASWRTVLNTPPSEPLLQDEH